jgi:hypothetical protein
MSLSMILNNLRTPVKTGVLLAGSFRFNGASAPTTVIGDVASVVRNGAGIWTVTFKTELKSRGVVCALASLELDAAADLSFIQTGPFTAASGTMQVRVFTEGGGTIAAADIAAGSNRGNWCHIIGLQKFGTAPDYSGIV